MPNIGVSLLEIVIANWWIGAYLFFFLIVTEVKNLHQYKTHWCTFVHKHTHTHIYICIYIYICICMYIMYIHTCIHTFSCILAQFKRRVNCGSCNMSCPVQRHCRTNGKSLTNIKYIDRKGNSLLLDLLIVWPLPSFF